MNKSLFLVCINILICTQTRSSERRVSADLKASLSRRISSSFVDIELQKYEPTVRVADTEFAGIYNVLAVVEKKINENIHAEISKFTPDELGTQITWLKGIQSRYTKQKDTILKRHVIVVTQWKKENEYEILKRVEQTINATDVVDEYDAFRTELSVSLYNIPTVVAPKDPSRPEFQIILNHKNSSWTCFGDGYKPHPID